MSVKYRSSIGQVSVNRQVYRPIGVLVDTRPIYRPVLDRVSTDVSTDISTDISTDVSVEAPHKIHDPKNVVKYLRATHHLFSNVFSETNRRLDPNYKSDNIASISKAKHLHGCPLQKIL